MAGQRNPDIQRLLDNLRGGGLINTGVNQTTAIADRSSNSLGSSQTPGPAPSTIPGLGFHPQNTHQIQHIVRSETTTPQPRPSSAAKPEILREHLSAPTTPDASSIITWPAALKFVTKYIVTNEKTVDKIKHLISEQHKHEQQWWAGREAIIARHSGRAGNQAKVADLLKALGGVSAPVATQDPRADQAELETYDKKVYKGLTSMAADFDRQLRGMQIPFFAIRHDLVIMGNVPQKEDGLKGRIDRGELRELQARMIETLQDLVGDD